MRLSREAKEARAREVERRFRYGFVRRVTTIARYTITHLVTLSHGQQDNTPPWAVFRADLRFLFKNGEGGQTPSEASTE